MKGMDIFCASQAATAICVSMEGEASSSTFPFGSSGRTIDRYNPIIRDPRRFGIGKTTPSPSPSPSSSQLALDTPSPKLLLNPFKNNNNNKKKKKKKNNNNSSSSNSNSNSNNVIDQFQRKKKKNSCKAAKYSSSSSSSNSNSKSSSTIAPPADFDDDDDDDDDEDHHLHKGIISNKSWRCTTKPGDFISPPGSSRYLLSEKSKFLNVISDFDSVLKLVPVEETSNTTTTTTAQFLLKNDDHHDDNGEFSPPPPPPPPPPPSSSLSQDQVVVVLRVSLHCRGCERKMRKHISRMEGVSSFNIDFAAKKVTVVGNVTPLGVLNSISKVKTAQLWNPSNSSIKNNSSAATGMMMMMKPSLTTHFHGGILS